MRAPRECSGTSWVCGSDTTRELFGLASSRPAHGSIEPACYRFFDRIGSLSQCISTLMEGRHEFFVRS